MGKPLNERLWELTIAVTATVVGGFILLKFDSIRQWLFSVMGRGVPLWVVLATAGVILVAVLWKQKSLPGEEPRRSRKAILQPEDVGAKQEVKQNRATRRQEVKDELAEYEEVLDEIDVAVLLVLVDPPPDRRARGIGVDLGMLEGRAEYQLEGLLERGYVKKLGFVGGGGYELTHKGRRYLVENGRI